MCSVTWHRNTRHWGRTARHVAPWARRPCPPLPAGAVRGFTALCGGFGRCEQQRFTPNTRCSLLCHISPRFSHQKRVKTPQTGVGEQCPGRGAAVLPACGTSSLPILCFRCTQRRRVHSFVSLWFVLLCGLPLCRLLCLLRCVFVWVCRWARTSTSRSCGARSSLTCCGFCCVCARGSTGALLLLLSLWLCADF